MCERKTALDHNIYFRATPYICATMNKELEQNKTYIYNGERGCGMEIVFLVSGPFLVEIES